MDLLHIETMLYYRSFLVWFIVVCQIRVDSYGLRLTHHCLASPYIQCYLVHICITTKLTQLMTVVVLNTKRRFQCQLCILFSQKTDQLCYTRCSVFSITLDAIKGICTLILKNENSTTVLLDQLNEYGQTVKLQEFVAKQPKRNINYRENFM